MEVICDFCKKVLTCKDCIPHLNRSKKRYCSQYCQAQSKKRRYRIVRGIRSDAAIEELRKVLKDYEKLCDKNK